MRVDVICRIVTPHLCAIAFTPPGDTSPWAVTTGPAAVVAQRSDRGVAALHGESQERVGAAMSRIGGETVARVDVAPRYARPRQGRREERSREALAVRRTLDRK